VFKQCFKQDTSSASKQDTSICTYVRYVRTNEELLTLICLLTFRIARGGA